tara:strand:+ start:989 stop:1441 length:453 start_codon:yes stop_codon:yes gene_type:complete
MEKYDGASALHFLSHNFEGHEIISVSMWGNPEIQHDVVQDILNESTEQYERVWPLGGNIRLCVENMGEYEPCVYHIDIYYEETHDIDSLLDEYARLKWSMYRDECNCDECLDSYEEMADDGYTYKYCSECDLPLKYQTDEPESPDQGGDE